MKNITEELIEDKIEEYNEIYIHTPIETHFFKQALEEVAEKAQIQTFNRLWDRSVGQTDDDLRAVIYLIRELKKLRIEIIKTKEQKESDVKNVGASGRI